MIDRLHLRLLQFCDPQLPTSVFSHSFGLETYVQRQAIHDVNLFKEWLELSLDEQLTYSGELAMRLVYNALNNGSTEEVLQLNQLIYVRNLPKGTCTGAKQVSTCTVRLTMKLHDSP